MSENKLEIAIQNSKVGTAVQAEIRKEFTPFMERLAKIFTDAKNIKVKDESDIEAMKTAKIYRKALKDLRIEADKTRKRMKEDSLNYGKAVQEAYNVIEGLIEPAETYLKQQEDFIEEQEKKHKAALQAERFAITSQYPEFIAQNLDLASLSEEQFKALVDIAKKQKADAEAEKLRKEEEAKKQAEENERLRKENERIKKEQEEQSRIRGTRANELAPYMSFIHDYTALIEKPEAEYQTQLADIKKGAELQWEEERKEQIRLQAEREEKERIARLEKAKADAERKIAEEKAAKAEKEKKEIEAKLEEKDRIAREALAEAEAERKAQEAEQKRLADLPEMEKLIEFAKSLRSLPLPEVKGGKAIALLNNVKVLLEKTAVYIETNAK